MLTQEFERDQVSTKLNGAYNKFNGDYKYNYDALTLKDYLSVLPGVKSKEKENNPNKWVCHCPLSETHTTTGWNNKHKAHHQYGVDTFPSLIIEYRTDDDLLQLQEEFTNNPAKFGNKNPQRVVVNCRSGVDCTQDRLMKWFHREFIKNNILKIRTTQAEFAYAKKNNLIVKRALSEVFPDKRKVKIQNQNKLFELELRGIIFDEYNSLQVLLRSVASLLQTGFDREYIAKEIEDWIEEHHQSHLRQQLDKLQIAVIKTKSKTDLIKAYVDARDELALYYDHETDSYPYDNPKFMKAPEEVRNYD